jgi:cytochrome P450
LLSGNLREFRSDMLAFYTQCARDYGDLVSFRLGLRRIYLLNRPEYIEDVLVTNNTNFIKTYIFRLLGPVLGNGLFLSEGDFWLRQRRLAQPAFHRDRIATYGGVMVASAEQMMEQWKDGETRDMHTEMTRLALRIVAKVLFDADVVNEAADVGAALEAVLETFNARFQSLFPLPIRIPTPSNRRLTRAVRRLDEIIFPIIQRRRAGGEERADSLSLLLNARDQDDGRGMTDRQVRDEVMNLFLAGHETTANMLSWIWYLLALHPEVEHQLQDELRATLDGRPPTVADLPRLRYTEMVINEAIRLYPPAYVIGREAMQGCAVGGYELPRGATVLMSQWVVHRDPRYFEAPQSFRPERWADGLVRRLPRFAYFPFGGGPRVCIGNSFSLVEAALLLATVAQRFRFTLLPEPPVVPWASVTLRPKHGVWALLHRR